MKKRLAFFLALMILLSLALPINALALPAKKVTPTADTEVIYSGESATITLGSTGQLYDATYKNAITDLKLSGKSVAPEYWWKHSSANSLIIDSYVLQTPGTYTFTIIATNYYDQDVTVHVFALKDPPRLTVRGSIATLGNDVLFDSNSDYLADISRVQVSGVDIPSGDWSISGAKLVLSKDIFHATGNYELVVFANRYEIQRRSLTIYLPSDETPPSDVKAVLSGQNPLLTWKDNSTVEIGFVVSRKVDGGEFQAVTTVSANTTQYLDQSAPGGTTCIYSIKASLPVEGDFPTYTTSSASAPIAVPMPAKTEGSMDNFLIKNTYKSGQFTDVDENAWYGFNQQKVIARAYEYGLMKGATATTFNPGGNFTIAEAVTVAARVHSIYMTGTENFVQGSPWYQVYVDYAVANGIIKAGDFAKYNVAATRAEMAYIFAHALPLGCYPKRMAGTVKTPPDVNASTPYQSSILLLYEAGIVGGSDAQGTFNPSNSITRAEVAAISTRLILTSTRLGVTFMPS